jgi:glycosyltransferase involved in cell wall biosynthesis
MTENAYILQLHRGSVYPPSNGEERRIWETAKKLSEFGTVWLAHPSGGEYEIQRGIRAVDTGNPFLEYKATRIYAWNAFFGVSKRNLFDRIQTKQTVQTLEQADVDFDVICCESPQMLRASWQLAERYDAPLLQNKHNAMFDLLDQQLELRPVPRPLHRRAVTNLFAFEQRGIERADAVVFQSEPDRGQFQIPDDTNVEVIPNGTHLRPDAIDVDSDDFRNRLDISETATVCLFIGAYDYDPNAAAADFIIRELAPELPEVEFLLVGRDPPTPDRPNVHALGFVEDLPSTLSAADIAVCPLTLGSGTKLKMMDYLAAGLPIVTTDVGAQGIPLQDGGTALICNSRRAFVDAIRELKESESLRSSLAANATALGREYHWQSILKSYEPIMRDLLE